MKNMSRSGVVTSGAHNPERVTSVRLFYGVFTDQFVFRTVLNSTSHSAKPTGLKMIFFCLLITFSFPFLYLILRTRP